MWHQSGSGWRCWWQTFPEEMLFQSWICCLAQNTGPRLVLEPWECTFPAFLRHPTKGGRVRLADISRSSTLKWLGFAVLVKMWRFASYREVWCIAWGLCGSKRKCTWTSRLRTWWLPVLRNQKRWTSSIKKRRGGKGHCRHINWWWRFIQDVGYTCTAPLCGAMHRITSWPEMPQFFLGHLP